MSKYQCCQGYFNACCFCISDEPISDPRGRIKTRENENKFQINMVITSHF